MVIGGHLGSRQEREAEQLAALRCIKIPHLADAIRWHGQSWSHVAEALDVDDRMLGVRLEHLHPAHRGQLKTLLAAHLEGMTA